MSTYAMNNSKIALAFINAMFYCSLLSLYLSLKFVIFFAIAFYFVFRIKSSIVYFFTKLTFPVLFLLFMFAYSSSQGNELQYVWFESRDILITVIELLMLNALVLVKGADDIIKILLKISCLIGFLKMIITAYCIATGINASVLVETISKTTGWELMTYDVDQSFISRIQFPIDLCSCFLMYYASTNLIKKLGVSQVIIFSGLLFSVLITMSRAFWFIGIVMFLLAIYNNSGSKRTFKYIIAIVILLSFAYISTYETTNKIISDRFSTNLTSSSDEARTIQNGLLYPQFEGAMFFGKGIGYYIPYFTRGEGDNKYAYESQVLAMFMKLGVVGFATLLFWFANIIFTFEKSLSFKILLTKSVFFALWIFSGSVNPLLFSTPGGLVLFLCSNIRADSAETIRRDRKI